MAKPPTMIIKSNISKFYHQPPVRIQLNAQENKTKCIIDRRKQNDPQFQMDRLMKYQANYEQDAK